LHRLDPVRFSSATDRFGELHLRHRRRHHRCLEPGVRHPGSNRATVPGAIYTGLTQSAGPSGPLPLAADFHDDRIDEFDFSLQKLDTAGLFRDPFLPRDYTPFNVQVLGNDAYVTYAKQNADKHMPITSGRRASGQHAKVRGRPDELGRLGLVPRRLPQVEREEAE
jgi:hypothetical protein